MKPTDYIDHDVIFELFPDAQIETDNDGQIIIYTGMIIIDSDGGVGPIECEGK